MARAMWKGIVTFADVHVPVKLYSAAEARGIHFRLLHGEDLEPVKQRMVRADTEEEVAREEIRKGYEIESGVHVLLDPEDLAQIDPPASRTISVSCFIPRGRLDAAWYDRPYWLGPDGDEAHYVALARALANTEREGIARWVMRKRAYAGSLVSDGDHLLLVTLHSVDEVVPADALRGPELAPPPAKEAKLAEQLIRALEGHFDLGKYHDQFRERTMELISSKAAGAELPRSKPRLAKTSGKSLADSLQKSIASLKEKKVA
jgi:DNA end-binding protein Ku